MSSSTTITTSRRRTSSSKRSKRGCVYELAGLLVDSSQKVVIITGAGLSVASGVRPFRGTGGVWSSVVYSKSTRHSFKKNPLEWYNKFWLAHFVNSSQDDTVILPNEGHASLECIVQTCPGVSIITQNIDGLHHSSQVIEAHGRLGLYKCIPDSDSDTDSDDDDEDDRLVHLGHRRKSRALRRAYYNNMNESKKNDDIMNGTKEGMNATTSTADNKDRVPCRYELVDSIPLNQIQPTSTHQALLGKEFPLREIPKCPLCSRPCPPQALLFDEGYHSHDHYQFEACEELLGEANVLVFVGTSFSGVRITQVALEHARSHNLRVYNFNTRDTLPHSSELHVQNVMGPAQETLPRLLEACQELQREAEQEQTRAATNKSSSRVNGGWNKNKRRGKRDRDPIMIKRARVC